MVEMIMLPSARGTVNPIRVQKGTEKGSRFGSSITRSPKLVCQLVIKIAIHENNENTACTTHTHTHTQTQASLREGSHRC